jgi:F420-dependent methylenetetrahydromethanopterin dehydrogenase
MAIKTKTQTLTSATRVKISPDTGIGAGAKLTIRAVDGVVRLYGNETTTDFVTFSNTNPLPGSFQLEKGDEMWAAADSTDVVLQTFLAGVAV